MGKIIYPFGTWRHALHRGKYGGIYLELRLSKYITEFRF